LPHAGENDSDTGRKLEECIDCQVYLTQCTHLNKSRKVKQLEHMADNRLWQSQNLTQYDTLILGAGISGLACASRLLEVSVAGNNVHRLQILEARDRIGGRIESIHVQGSRLDTGANWIHGTGNAERPNPLMEILPQKRYKSMKGSVLFKAPNEHHCPVFDPCELEEEICTTINPNRISTLTPPATAPSSPGVCNALSIPADAARLIMSSVQKAIAEVQDLATTIPADEANEISILWALQNAKALHEAFDTVPEEYHHTLGALLQGIESMEAAPLLAQTGELNRPESAPGVGLLEYAVNDYDGEQVFLQDGFAAVVEELADPLMKADAIALEMIVTRIDWTSNPIVVETTQGNFAAKEVVCTFPLGVLKDNKDALFMPGLPFDKQEAIESLGFGTLDKMFAIYSHAWWDHEPYKSIVQESLSQMKGGGDHKSPDSFLGFTTELSGISVRRNGTVCPDVYRLPILNLQSLTGQPVLGAFVSCRSAATVEEMTDEEVANMFHRTLTQWFGREPPRPTGVHVTRWAQDPFSRGSYSHVITNSCGLSHREALQKPVVNDEGGVLRFAGEHCSRDHFAMVHGALLDGWRVADTITQK
jgi:N1-acetylpolyamine oxidase